jgi:hypothetical protein
MKNLETIDIVMIALTFVMAIIGTIGLFYFHKTYAVDESKERNTTMLMKMADDDNIGLTILSYAFAWMITIGCWGVLLFIFVIYIFK